MATTYPVSLFVYDMSRGMARTLSQALLGHQLDGIWHTGIVVYETEYFYGGAGAGAGVAAVDEAEIAGGNCIISCPPGGTILGEPLQRIPLGHTQIPQDTFKEYLDELGQEGGPFGPGTYELFTHNCNNFSNEAAEFLVGQGIPEWILDLPKTVLNTPLGQILHQFSKTNMLMGRPGAPNSSASSSTSTASRRTGKDPGPAPPKTFKSDDESESEIQALLNQFEELTADTDLFGSKETISDFRAYALGTHGLGSWSLEEDWIQGIQKLLVKGNSDKYFSLVTTVFKIMAWLAVTKPDIIHILHQDNKAGAHGLLTFASKFDQLSSQIQVQEAVATFLCNLFANVDAAEWALYTSPWDNEQTWSNLRVVTKVGIHSLLSMSSSKAKHSKLNDIGLAILHNLLNSKKLAHLSGSRGYLPGGPAAETVVDISLALLQWITMNGPSATSDDPAFLSALQSLLRACQLSPREIPDLVKVIGPGPREIRKMLSGNSNPKFEAVIAEIKACLN